MTSSLRTDFHVPPPVIPTMLLFWYLCVCTYIHTTLAVTSIQISFCLSSNNTPSSPPYNVGSKRKSVPEEKSNDESPAGIGDDDSYYPLVIYDDLKMFNMSGGNCSLNKHTLSQQYCDSNNGDVSSGYGF